MPIYRAQIGFPLDSALPRDVVTVNPHYFGDNPSALAEALKVSLIALPAIGATHPFTIKIYDAQKAPPSYPLYSVSSASGFSTTAQPKEIALCLSYYSSYNRPSYRGRLFIPGYFVGGVFSTRPTSTQRDTAGTWATALGKNLPNGHNWVVFSKKRNASDGVTNWWVDDEWDTVRSRGGRPTLRTVGTIPQAGVAGWPTYSTRFIGAGGSEGWRTYVVPGAHRAVVKNIMLTLRGGASGVALVTVAGTSVINIQLLAGTTYLSLQTHLVAYGGEAIELYLDGPAVYGMIGGFLFAEGAGASADDPPVAVLSPDRPPPDLTPNA